MDSDGCFRMLQDVSGIDWHILTYWIIVSIPELFSQVNKTIYTVNNFDGENTKGVTLKKQHFSRFDGKRPRPFELLWKHPSIDPSKESAPTIFRDKGLASALSNAPELNTNWLPTKSTTGTNHIWIYWCCTWRSIKVGSLMSKFNKLHLFRQWWPKRPFSL